MFKHILMPTDGSEHSEHAITRGIELAKLCGARVTGIHVMMDYLTLIAGDDSFTAGMENNFDARAHKEAERFLEFVQRAADVASVPCDTLVTIGRHPYNIIVDAANERGCDLIVMTARHRRGLGALIMGGEASRVLHRASIPVLTFRGLMSSDHPDRNSLKS